MNLFITIVIFGSFDFVIFVFLLAPLKFATFDLYRLNFNSLKTIYQASCSSYLFFISYFHLFSIVLFFRFLFNFKTTTLLHFFKALDEYFSCLILIN